MPWMSFRHYSWSCTVFPSLLFVPCQLSSSRLYSQDETRQDLKITEMVGIEKFVSKSRDLCIYRTQFRIFLSFAGIICPSICPQFTSACPPLPSLFPQPLVQCGKLIIRLGYNNNLIATAYSNYWPYAMPVYFYAEYTAPAPIIDTHYSRIRYKDVWNIDINSGFSYKERPKNSYNFP